MNEYNYILNKINKLIKKYGRVPKKYRLKKLKQPNELSTRKAEKIYTELSAINKKINRILQEYPIKERPKIKRKISLYKKQTKRTVEAYADKLNVKRIKEEKKLKNKKDKTTQPVKRKKVAQEEYTEQPVKRKKTGAEEYPDYSEIVINNFILNMQLIFSHNPPLLEYILGWLFTMIDNYGQDKTAIALDKAKSDGDWPDWEDISDEARVRGKLNRISQVLEIPGRELEEILYNNESYETV